MRVGYFAVLRDIAGKKEEDWTRPAATVGALLRDLAEKYGPEFRRWVLDDRTAALAIVLVNGHDVRGLQWFDTPLASTDTVTIIPPVGGG